MHLLLVLALVLYTATTSAFAAPTTQETIFCAQSGISEQLSLKYGFSYFNIIPQSMDLRDTKDCDYGHLGNVVRCYNVHFAVSKYGASGKGTIKLVLFRDQFPARPYCEWDRDGEVIAGILVDAKFERKPE